MDRFFRLIIIACITVYQKIFTFKPPTCRYYPSCSQYSLQAFKKYHFFKALSLSFIRVLKCNPLFPGGYDPVITPEQSKRWKKELTNE